MNMANIWLSKVQKLFEIRRRIRPLSTQNKNPAAIWLADTWFILCWHLFGSWKVSRFSSYLTVCSKLKETFQEKLRILFILNLDSWQKLIKNRSVGNIGFWCSYVILQEINIAQITILQIIVQQIKSSQTLVFDDLGKPEYPGKNLSGQSREPKNSIHIWRRMWKLNPGSIGERQLLSPIGQACQFAVCL